MKIHVTSASAGSGKTYYLAERTYAAITKERVRPEAIMAITYTNKAAAELRHRLRKKLVSAGQNEAAARLRDGYVGTVHSISQRIVAELAFETGKSPFPTLAPETHGPPLSG